MPIPGINYVIGAKFNGHPFYATHRGMIEEWTALIDKNGDGNWSQNEVDENNDGKLDERFAETLSLASFRFLQINTYYQGYIHKLYTPKKFILRDGTNPKNSDLEIAYLQFDPSFGGERVYAYFSSEEDLKRFQNIHPETKGQEKIPAKEVDYTFGQQASDRVDDFSDPTKMLPDLGPEPFQLNNANRPYAGTSPSGFYYRADVTKMLLDIAPKIFHVLNKNGSNNANCAYAVLFALGSIEIVEQNIDPALIYRDSDFLKKLGLTEITTEERGIGDIVFLVYEDPKTHQEWIEHVYLDLGYGWVFTKNGISNPYRLQRRAHVESAYGLRDSMLQRFSEENHPPLKEVRFRMLR